jgi:2-C-methyl-D-erythritol 4-phosphate cytidylyltransferase
LKSSADFVLIHDAVRPFVSADVILKTINTAEKFDFAICGIKLRDSLKIVDKNCIIKSENRERFILSHTPQVFRRKPLENALRYANKNEIVLYDDSQALEIAGSSVKFIESNLYNIKITHIDDIDFAKYLIKNDL